MVKTGTPSNLKSLMSGRGAILCFFATWGNTGESVMPVWIELSNTVPFPVITINVNIYPELAEKYWVKGTPTTILVFNGQEMMRMNGDITLSAIMGFVYKYI